MCTLNVVQSIQPTPAELYKFTLSEVWSLWFPLSYSRSLLRPPPLMWPKILVTNGLFAFDLPSIKAPTYPCPQCFGKQSGPVGEGGLGGGGAYEPIWAVSEGDLFSIFDGINITIIGFAK